MTAAGSPRVNLMPPEIAEAARFRQIQVALGAALLLAVVLVGFLYLNAHSSVSDAQDELDQAQQQQTALQTKLNSLASVQQTLDAVQAKQTLLNQAMGTEVRWSFMLNDLAFRVPSDVWLTQMAVTETATGTAAPVATGATTLGATAPVTTGTFPIGTVTFNGVGFNHDDVAKWLDAMTKMKGFLNPTFSSSTEAAIGDRSTVNFQGAASLTSSLFSNRYVASPASSGTGIATP
jgi:Tfp pilus assembly protein PilN